MFQLPIPKAEKLCRDNELYFTNSFYPSVGIWHAQFFPLPQEGGGGETQCVADAMDENYAKAVMYAGQRLKHLLKMNKRFEDSSGPKE